MRLRSICVAGVLWEVKAPPRRRVLVRYNTRAQNGRHVCVSLCATNGAALHAKQGLESGVQASPRSFVIAAWMCAGEKGGEAVVSVFLHA